MMGQILKIGFPVAVQDGCIQIAFLLITVIANHRGLDDAAAVGNRGKDHQRFVYCAVLYAGDSLGAVGAEYRCRKA